MAEHELKTWPEFFESILSGRKKFEVRRNDRNFKLGDTLCLKEYNPLPRGDIPEYTGRKIRANVDYVLDGYNWGVRVGFVVMSISLQDKKPAMQTKKSG